MGLGGGGDGIGSDGMGGGGWLMVLEGQKLLGTSSKYMDHVTVPLCCLSVCGCDQ